MKWWIGNMHKYHWDLKPGVEVDFSFQMLPVKFWKIALFVFAFKRQEKPSSWTITPSVVVVKQPVCIYIYIFMYMSIYIYTHAYTQEIDSQYVAFYIHLASWLLPVSPLAICFIHFTCLLVQKLWGNNINKWGTQVSTRASLAIVVLFWWGGISQLWELATSLIGVSLPHSTFAPGIAIRSCVEGFTSAAFWKHLGLCWHIKTEPALKQIGQFFHLASISNLPFITAKNAGSRTDPINLSHTNFKNRSEKENQLRIFS